MALPETDLDGSFITAENFRHAIQSISGLAVTKTASIGIASERCVLGMRANLDLLADLVDRADQALYAAKNARRNCICHIVAVPQSGNHFPAASA